MRLIDANKYLEKVCIYKETGCGSCKLQTTCPKDAPTVKAIPVEWIKKYIKQNYCPCDLVYPKEFLKELVTWWRYDENEYKENTSQTD